MKLTQVFRSTLAIGIAAAGVTASAASGPDAALLAQAKISQAAATTTALAKVPNGTVKEVELEKEHGRLVWSFDITTPRSVNVTEVQVDARSGEIVSTHTETPTQQRREAQQDKAGKRSDGD